MLSLVVVEDNESLLFVTVEALRLHGHFVRGVSCAEDLDDEIGSEPFDIAIIDINLPGEDGLSLTRRLRAAQPDVGIILVTARNSPAERVQGYKAGADIYVPKPASVDELSMAIQALRRRLGPTELSASNLRDANVVLDQKTLRVSFGDKEIKVSTRDAAILSSLARASNRRLDSWQLMSITVQNEDAFSKGGLEVQITRVRKKLIQLGLEKDAIRSVRGVGYQLCVPLIVK
ncbi:MAG: two component transcriptional regulator, winged helix family [Hyphomicrobiales bacterium]|nr:two component transcriptional regulator, winged helix family [Hyphomicrobiales bacterium]